MLYLTLCNYCLNIGYINSLLFIILLFITYIFLKKEFFSTPCKVKEKEKKFLLVQELSRTFLINTTYFPLPFFIFTIFSYCKPL